MKKTLLAILILAAFGLKAQTTLDQRVSLLANTTFTTKLKIAMTNVAIGVLSAPLSENVDSAATQLQKKYFAKQIITEPVLDRYVFAIISTGSVSDTTPDVYLLAAISTMFDYFAAYKEQTGQ